LPFHEAPRDTAPAVGAFKAAIGAELDERRGSADRRLLDLAFSEAGE
jgi:hypothetical protein